MKRGIILIGLIFVLFCSFVSAEGIAYRKTGWSWQSPFDYFVNIQYSDDKVTWYNALPSCTHVRFREGMDQQAPSWDDVGAHRYWSLHVCGTGGTPPFKIWEMDWFTYDGSNYVEKTPTTAQISSGDPITLFDASKLVDNNIDTLGLQRDDPGTSESRLFIIDTQTGSCTESWSCDSWSSCINNQQTRTCTDSNNCGTTADKPATTQSCTIVCTESWNCGVWSTCTGGQQTRTCTDANNCGTIVNKPIVTQSCTCIESWNCNTWSNCINGQQTRTCIDANNCGTIVNKPIVTQSCTCIESWNCGALSNCVNGQQTRTCTDANNCGTMIYKPAVIQNCNIDVKPPISASVPNVLAKSVDGIINGHDGRLVFEISNEDSNHKLEGYLSCSIPSDVVVTSSTGAASGTQGQYISEAFAIGPAPDLKSMNLGLSSQSSGSKLVSCTVNYVLFKDGKGYLTNNGDYSSEKKYFTVNINRDVNFNVEEAIVKEEIAKVPQETVESNKTIEISQQNIIWGLVAFVVLLLAYLLGKSSKSN